MTVQLAPRPKNEQRRVVAVKRTGIIDNNQEGNFSIFCDLGRELTGFDYAAFSLFDENFQCKISATDGSANDKSERDEFNVCSYVLLSSEPTLIHDLSKHTKWKSHPKIISGESKYLGYAGFPVINKDNYALGTLCLLNGEPLSLSQRQIALIKSLAERIAHQIDLQTDQKETTSDTMHNAILKFSNRVRVNDLNLLNIFLNVCSGKIISEEEFKQLKDIGLAKKDQSHEIVLTEGGASLLSEMKLQPKVMKRNVIDTGERPTFLDDLLGEL